jgi:membrane protein DedA with SNARE-associated domain
VTCSAVCSTSTGELHEHVYAPFRFVLYTIVGSGVYNLVLVGLGYVLGSRWKTVEQYSNYLNYAIYAAIAIAVGLFVVKRLRRRGAHQPTGTA